MRVTMGAGGTDRALAGGGGTLRFAMTCLRLRSERGLVSVEGVGRKSTMRDVASQGNGQSAPLLSLIDTGRCDG